MKKSLIVMPTHANCTEVMADFNDAGLYAVKYPARLGKSKTIPCPRCHQEKGMQCSICNGDGSIVLQQNCWNEPDASVAENMGLPLIKTICIACDHRERCLSNGYLYGVDAAKNAEVSVATHARAKLNSLGKLCDGRPYVSIHENAVDTLRPTIEFEESDLEAVRERLDELLLADSRESVQFLNFFGSGDSDIQRLRRSDCYDFTLHILELCEWLLKQINQAPRTCEIPLENRMKRPPGIERLLFREFRDVKFQSGPFKVLLDAADGSLYSLGIVVQVPTNKKPDNRPAEPARTLLGVWRNDPPQTGAVWFSDATANEERLANLLGRDVHNTTPNGCLKRLKQAAQIPRDITRGTSAAVVQGLVRGVLADRPEYRQVGVICHSNHSEAVENLGHPFASRVVKVAYFGSGEERSSNDWHQICDLIIVVGTPRLHPDTIQQYLVQVGEFATAGRDGQWGDFHWRGETASGETRTVTGRGYSDSDWQQAHRELVRAGIVQAIGRGRGILEEGCDVIVLATEECGLLLADELDVEPVKKKALDVYQGLEELSARNANRYLIGNLADNSGFSTAEIAVEAGVSERSTREHLERLERAGLVIRCGERRGWLLAASGESFTFDER